MTRIGGFRTFGKDPTYKKNGKSRFGKNARTAAGRAMEASRAQREAEVARDEELAYQLDAFLAACPKPVEPKKLVKTEHELAAETQQAALQTTIATEPSPRDPTPAERERDRAEQGRLAQLAKDWAVEIEIAWQQIQRDAARCRAALGAGPDTVIEFTPTAGGRCATHDYPLTYATDWRAPECPVCRQQALQQPKGAGSE